MHETANFHQQGFSGAARSGVVLRKDGPLGSEHQVLPDLLREQAMTEAEERSKRIDAKLKRLGDLLDKMDARDRISRNVEQAMAPEAERFERIDTQIKLVSDLLDKLATRLDKPGSAAD